MRHLINCIFQMIMCIFKNPVGPIDDDFIVCKKVEVQRSAEGNEAHDRGHDAKKTQTVNSYNHMYIYFTELHP